MEFSTAPQPGVTPDFHIQNSFAGVCPPVLFICQDKHRKWNYSAAPEHDKGGASDRPQGAPCMDTLLEMAGQQFGYGQQGVAEGTPA